MAPRKCVGFTAAEGEVEPCVFNANTRGGPATAKFGGRCVWCSPEEMGRRLAEPRLEKLLVYTLVNFKSANEEVFEKAKARLSEDRRAGVLAEVDARLEPKEEDADMAPAVGEVEGYSEEEDEAEEGLQLGIVSDDLGEGAVGQLDISKNKGERTLRARTSQRRLPQRSGDCVASRRRLSTDPRLFEQ